MEILAQILGYVGLLVAVVSMLFRNKVYILLAMTLYNFLTIITYLILGQYLACILVGIAIVRSIVFVIFELKNLKPNLVIYILFNVLFITASVFFWNDWYDIFMLVNLIVYTYITWQPNVNLIKIGVAFCSILYILYDIFAGAYSYIFGEVAFGATALYSIIKERINIKKNLQNSEIKENQEIKIEEN